MRPLEAPGDPLFRGPSFLYSCWIHFIPPAVQGLHVLLASLLSELGATEWQGWAPAHSH